MLNADIAERVWNLQSKGWYALTLTEPEHPLKFKNKVVPVVNLALVDIRPDHFLVGRKDIVHVMGGLPIGKPRFAVEMVLTRTPLTEAEYWEAQLLHRRYKSEASDYKRRVAQCRNVPTYKLACTQRLPRLQLEYWKQAYHAERNGRTFR